MSRHRGSPLRPRYGRISALGSALAVTGVAILGATGVLPSAATDDRRPAASAPAPDQSEGRTSPPEAVPDPAPRLEARRRGSADATESRSDPARDLALPTRSGEGHRVVFSEGRQRVWLVEDGGEVLRTYLVSGSIYDNLDPGTYSVYSRSEQAYGIDSSGSMKYFVRFARGDRAAIGFHDIPIDSEGPIQTIDQLGTPLSHGCIRQRRSDAIAMWEFAPLDTTVVVTA
ncbi:MAG: L,D-transpeptidase [Nocardioidaceae bacterium]